MPWLAFAANFLWVLVLGLLGPSVPAILSDLGLGYARVGLFFTLMSLGSLFGTSLGAVASDFVNRKVLLLSVTASFVAGLVLLSLSPGWLAILGSILLLSLAGSPLGAIGQGIMLDMFPERRERYLALQTFCSASGSFLAPLLVSMNLGLSGDWRLSFLEAAGLAAAFGGFTLLTRLPPAGARRSGAARQPVRVVLRHPAVLWSAALIFFCVAPDFGFSAWLAEYFRSELQTSLRLSSAAVGVYLAGILAGRWLTSRLVRRLQAARILAAGLTLSLVALPLLLVLPGGLKAAAVLLYGLGIGPVFPLLMAMGTRAWPGQPGVVTGVLFGSLSLGGMVFPLLMGLAASRLGIGRAYWGLEAVLLGLLIGLGLRGRRERRALRPAA